MTRITHSEQETIQLAKKIASQFKPGTVLGLVGELGTGKTQFVKGLAKGLGIKKPITSPSFVLIKSYKLKAISYKLIHIDCYRLSNSKELLDLGWQELIQNKNSLIAVEWADKIKQVMPKNTVWVKFKMDKKPNERKITLKSQE